LLLGKVLLLDSPVAHGNGDGRGATVGILARSECYAKARLLSSNSNNNSPRCGTAQLRDAW